MSPRRAALAALAAVAAVYGLVRVDVILRARSAYYEGEKYLEWNRSPNLKKVYFDARLAKTEARLRKEFSAGKLPADVLSQRLTLARFERDERVAESSLKYAYIWFKTAVDLFTPPESRWVARSRAKMAETKELWKRELDSKGIAYKDYMLE